MRRMLCFKKTAVEVIVLGGLNCLIFIKLLFIYAYLLQWHKQAFLYLKMFVVTFLPFVKYLSSARELF